MDESLPSPFPPAIMLGQTSWLHCIVCDCITGTAGSFVDEDGYTHCGVCGSPIVDEVSDVD